jgi:hypothetical protein
MAGLKAPCEVAMGARWRRREGEGESGGGLGGTMGCYRRGSDRGSSCGLPALRAVVLFVRKKRRRKERRKKKRKEKRKMWKFFQT